MTRELGFAYLWIDSLCIVQGDEADWQNESAKMASVYADAALTIAAAAGKIPWAGLFGRQASSLHSQLGSTRIEYIKTPDKVPIKILISEDIRATPFTDAPEEYPPPSPEPGLCKSACSPDVFWDLESTESDTFNVTRLSAQTVSDTRCHQKIGPLDRAAGISSGNRFQSLPLWRESWKPY